MILIRRDGHHAPSLWLNHTSPIPAPDRFSGCTVRPQSSVRSLNALTLPGVPARRSGRICSDVIHHAQSETAPAALFSVACFVIRVYSAEMSRPFDPTRKRPAFAPDPIPCEDCGALLDPNEHWSRGQQPRLCRSCQNKRYEAKTRNTPQGERRRRRNALLAKQRRLEARIQRDTVSLENVRQSLAAGT